MSHEVTTQERTTDPTAATISQLRLLRPLLSLAALQVWGTINIKQVELYPGIAHSSWPLRPLHSWVGLKPRQTCGSPSPTTTPPERDNRPQSVAKHRNGWWLRTAVTWTYLEEPDPVVTGPGVLGTDCVVAVNSALREVAAAHISELHTLLHRPCSRIW